MKAKFKRSQLAMQDSKTITLQHPVHGDTGIQMTVAGPTHPQWKEALEIFTSKPEDDENRGRDLFSAAVLGWDEEAMEVPFSKEAVKAIFENDGEEWIAANIVKATQDPNAFFPDIS